MIPDSITLRDLAQATHTFIWTVHRLCRVSGRLGLDSPATPHDVLILGIADTVSRAVPGMDREGPLGLFLHEIRPYLEELAFKLEEVWGESDPESKVPDYCIGFAENKFVNWTNLKQFYHVESSTYAEKLPATPTWATTLHVAAIYFQVRNVLKEIEDARRTKNVAEPSV